VGAGVAAGGNTGQFLKKNSTTNYDTSWSTVAGAVYQPSAPSSPQNGDIWIDSDATASVINTNDFLLKADAATTYGTGYRYLNTVYYTSSGTFSKASYPGLRAIRVKVVAGGGSGGGAGTTTAGQVSGSGGGGGGAYAESFITDIAGLASSITVTVGAGATGVTGNVSGNTGGSSSFGTAVVCAGGTGGVNGGSRVPSDQFGDGGSGGDASAGDFRISGSGGGAFFAQSVARTYPGYGGGSFVGGSTRTIVNTTSGWAGQNYGGGSSGVSNLESQAVNRTSPAGANGIVIVEVYV
jgi:hypothetical protein